MRGLLPRSLPSLIPYNPDLSSGSSCSLFCGDLRRLSPGHLCCSSKTSLTKSGCWGKFSAGRCIPLGVGGCGPVGTGVSSTASTWGSLSLHPSCPGGIPFPPPRLCQQLPRLPPGRYRLRHEYQHGPFL